MQRLGVLNASLKERPEIHRIELLDRFYEVLNNRELVFVRPGCWEDPLENVIFNGRLLENNKLVEHPAKNAIYGQCWSYDADSYALWKIYTLKKNDRGAIQQHQGVRITTHLDRLKQLSSLNKGLFGYGLMDYIGKEKIEALPKDLKIIRALKENVIGEGHMKLLLLKRKAYRYESELRLMTVPDASLVDKKNTNLCRVKINPIDFISSVRFDPAMDASEFQAHKQLLVETYGFRKTQITQSTYHKKNDLTFRIAP